MGGLIRLRTAGRFYYAGQPQSGLYLGGQKLWSAPVSGSDLPPWTVEWTASRYAGPTRYGDIPAAANGVVEFEEAKEAVRILATMTPGMYFVIAYNIRKFGPLLQDSYPVITFSHGTGSTLDGTYDQIPMTLLGVPGAGEIAIEMYNDGWSQGGTFGGVPVAPGWLVFEGWFDATGQFVMRINGGDPQGICTPDDTAFGLHQDQADGRIRTADMGRRYGRPWHRSHRPHV